MKWLDANRDVFLDLLRIYLGIGLLVKGVHFIGNGGALLQTLELRNVPYAGMALAHYIALAHLVGGLFLGAGFLTRIAALVQVPILVGAVFYVHLREGLFTAGQTLEFSALVLFMLLVFSLAGAGRLSLDHFLFQDDVEASPNAAPAP